MSAFRGTPANASNANAVAAPGLCTKGAIKPAGRITSMASRLQEQLSQFTEVGRCTLTPLHS